MNSFVFGNNGIVFTLLSQKIMKYCVPIHTYQHFHEISLLISLMYSVTKRKEYSMFTIFRAYEFNKNPRVWKRIACQISIYRNKITYNIDQK